MKRIKFLGIALILALSLIGCSNDDSKPSTSDTPIVDTPSVTCNVKVKINRVDTYPNPDVILDTQNREYYLRDLPTWYSQDGAVLNFSQLNCGETDFYSKMGANFIRIDYYRDATEN